MNAFQITNQNFKYVNQNINPNERINSPKRISKYPYNMSKYNYGEKIREKKNYTLYASGSGYQMPIYEERPKRIKIIKDKYNISKMNNIDVYDEEENNILSSSDNYGYKETKNIKNENPNLKVVTIHRRLGSPRQIRPINTPQRNRKLKIKKEENIFWNREYSPNNRININNNNEQIRILKENKSSEYFRPLRKNKFFEKSFESQKNGELIQEIIQDDYDDYNGDSRVETSKDGDYFYKVTTKRKEFIPENNYYNNRNISDNYRRNRNGKIIKIIKNNEPLYNNQKNYRIYNKEYIKRDNYENEPYYIGNYGEEENYEPQDKYKKNNYLYKDRDEYEQEENIEQQNQRYINENRDIRCEYINERDNNYMQDIRDIKSIECPMHGKISIIIHKNPFGYN